MVGRVLGFAARRKLGTLLVSTALAASALVALPAPPVEAQTPTPPTLPAFGGNGPCTVSTTEATNTAFSTQKVFLVQPGGTAMPGLTGGTCNGNNRPVVLLAHGYVPCDPDGTPPDGVPGQPPPYQALVNNLVSNGFIVAFPSFCLPSALDIISPYTQSYDMVNTGFTQAMGMTLREDTTRVGVIGHSYGGGMVGWLAEQTKARSWGGSAMWLSVFAPIFPLRGANPYDIPAHARTMNVIFQHDHVCAEAGLGPEVCNIPFWSSVHYDRFSKATARWGVKVNSDISHPPGPNCSAANNSNQPLCAHHYVPSYATNTTHLQYFGVYRNLHALWQCTKTPQPSGCNADRTFMGVWSDGVEATRASHCTPTSCP
jgi:hypothetical protein